jgi:hypothetical protein
MDGKRYFPLVQNIFIIIIGTGRKEEEVPEPSLRRGLDLGFAGPIFQETFYEVIKI